MVVGFRMNPARRGVVVQGSFRSNVVLVGLPLPSALDRGLELVGRIASPLALITVGIPSDLSRLRSDTITFLAVSASKLMLYPAVLYGVLIFLEADGGRGDTYGRTHGGSQPHHDHGTWWGREAGRRYRSRWHSALLHHHERMARIVSRGLVRHFPSGASKSIQCQAVSYCGSNLS